MIHELRCHFWVELPKGLEAELVQRAETVFARHKRWRKKAQGEQGPDYVRSFMRHWLAALLFKCKQPLLQQTQCRMDYRQEIANGQGDEPK